MRPADPRSLILFLAAVAACGGGGEAERGAGAAVADSAPGSELAASEGGQDLTAICDTIDNSFRCARAIERSQLPAAARASRNGDTLRLRLTSGDSVSLVDVSGEGGGVVYFSYQRHWPQAGLFVVQQQYYEGSEFLLVDHDTGARTTVPDRPLLAPGGDRFAVLSADLVAGYGPNTIQIWALDEGAPTLEWELEPDGWGATDGEWIGPEALRFRRQCGPRTEGEPFCGEPATLERAADGWSIGDGGPGA